MTFPSLKMNTGAEIPQIGLGTWMLDDETECKNAVKWALETGYRHIDTAQYYQNEQFIGQAVKDSGVKREDIFITTKIAVSNMGPRLNGSFEESLIKLQMDYVDLLLIHFPVSESRRESWPLMEDIYNAGKAKAIGVSNYMVRHMEEVLSDCKVKPAVNQFELHPFLQTPELVDYCQEHGVIVEAYCPLVRGHRHTDPVLTRIAKKHNKTVAQIMLRWEIDIGAVTIPKSAHKDRLKENFDVFSFKLDEDDMENIKQLDSGFHVTWDPTDVA